MMLWRMMSRCRRQKPTHVKVKNNTWGGGEKRYGGCPVTAEKEVEREQGGNAGNSNTKGAIVAAVVVFGQLETFVEALKCTQNGILTHADMNTHAHTPHQAAVMGVCSDVTDSRTLPSES